MHTVDLTGKRALVTGSSRGLGRHYALHLARAGADVIVHDVNERAAAEFGEAPSGPAVAEQIRALGRRSAFFGADLTDPAQAEYLVQQVLTTLGHLDILVNNAGGDIGCRTPRPDANDALEIDPDDIRCVLERNLQVCGSVYARAASGQDHQRGVHGGPSPCSHRHDLCGSQASHCPLDSLPG